VTAAAKKKSKRDDARPSALKVALPGAKRGPGTYYLDPDEVVLVGLDPIKGYCPETGRTHELYNVDVQQPPPADLLKRVRREGALLIPIKVRREGEYAVCVEGRDRVKVLRLLKQEAEAAGQPVIQAWCLPERGSAHDMLSRMVDCNMGRKVDNPITVASWAVRLQAAGLDAEEVSSRVKLSAREIPLLCRLLDCCAEVQAAVVAATIPWRKAARLSGLSVKEQLAALKPKPKAAVTLKRPGKKRLDSALANERLPAAVRSAIEWATGRISDAEAAEQIKGFAAVAPAEDPAQAKFQFAEVGA
jgi:hypothetical protein